MPIIDIVNKEKFHVQIKESHSEILLCFYYVK